MDLQQKLAILADGAKYDVACTSSGVSRKGTRGRLGNTHIAGLCHSFTSDGRCISLLKVLMSNNCAFNCAYCIHRRSNDLPRATFSPRELAELVIGMYRRNYVEGLFLSSGVLRTPDATMERMIECLRLLRQDYSFGGYIHAKTIPGASPALIRRIGLLADRVSVNLELPSERSLNLLAPDKPRENILRPMGLLRSQIAENRHDLVQYRHTPAFAPAGQSTQMIIGATPDTDFQIIRLAESLYNKYALRRVFYSGYIPVGGSALLPQGQPVPLLREHRLYQADWLIRVYGFRAGELLSPDAPDLDPLLDPKCQWALRHAEQFPVDVQTADAEQLLRVPGIGPIGARKILAARRMCRLSFEDLKKLGVVLKRAKYFITANGRAMPGVRFHPDVVYRSLTEDTLRHPGTLPIAPEAEQLSLFEAVQPAFALPNIGRGGVELCR